MNTFFEPGRRPPYRGRPTTLAVALLFALSSTASAFAADPPDVVRLKNGGMVRGTILEALPGETVRVQMSDGKVREFAADTIEFAGPEQSPNSATLPAKAALPVAPVAAPTSEVTSAASVVSDKVRVHLVSPDAAATFGINAGTTNWVGAGAAFTGRGVAPAIMAGVSAHYATLCTAPCAVDLQRGTHQFNLTLPDGRAAISERVVIPSAGQLQADYVSRSGVRAAGWVTLIGGGILGTLVAINSHEKCEPFLGSEYCEDEYPTLVPGMVILLVSTVAGIIMGVTRDKVDTFFAPGS